MDILGKTTDENLTAENWELILNLCDKVVDEGEAGYASQRSCSVGSIHLISYA